MVLGAPRFVTAVPGADRPSRRVDRCHRQNRRSIPFHTAHDYRVEARASGPAAGRRGGAGSERRAETADLVAEARAFVAAQEIAAEERLHDVMEHHWGREDGHDDEAARWRVR